MVAEWNQKQKQKKKEENSHRCISFYTVSADLEPVPDPFFSVATRFNEDSEDLLDNDMF